MKETFLTNTVSDVINDNLGNDITAGNNTDEGINENDVILNINVDTNVKNETTKYSTDTELNIFTSCNDLLTETSISNIDTLNDATNLDNTINEASELDKTSFLNDTVSNIPSDTNNMNEEFVKFVPSKRTPKTKMLDYESLRFDVYKNENQTGFLTDRPLTWLQELRLYSKLVHVTCRW